MFYLHLYYENGNLYPWIFLRSFCVKHRYDILVIMITMIMMTSISVILIINNVVRTSKMLQLLYIFYNQDNVVEFIIRSKYRKIQTNTLKFKVQLTKLRLRRISRLLDWKVMKFMLSYPEGRDSGRMYAGVHLYYRCRRLYEKEGERKKEEFNNYRLSHYTPFWLILNFSHPAPTRSCVNRHSTRPVLSEEGPMCSLVTHSIRIPNISPNRCSIGIRKENETFDVKTDDAKKVGQTRSEIKCEANERTWRRIAVDEVSVWSKSCPAVERLIMRMKNDDITT